MKEEFVFLISLKNGQKREVGYLYTVHVLSFVDEYFLGQSLAVPSADNALHVAGLLQLKFSNIIESVVVIRDGTPSQ